MMNRTLLLAASLSINVLLLVTIGFLIRGESDILPSAASMENVTPVAFHPSMETAALDVPTIGEVNRDNTPNHLGNGYQPEITKSADRRGANGVARNSPNSPISDVRQVIAPIEERPEPTIEGYQQVASRDPLTQVTNSSPGSISIALNEVAVRSGNTGPAGKGEIAAKLSTIRPEARESVSEAREQVPASVGASPAKNEDGSIVAIEIGKSKRPPWPRGVLTPEQEVYRMRYGWEASNEAIREEALGPRNP